MLWVPWSPGFVLGLPPRGVLKKKSKWPWNMIHSMPCKDPCRLYIHLWLHILRWSLKHSAKQTWTSSAFSTNENGWSAMVTCSQSRACEVALQSMWPHYIFLEVSWDGLWTLSFGFSQFYGQNSWLVCEVDIGYQVQKSMIWYVIINWVQIIFYKKFVKVSVI